MLGSLLLAATLLLPTGGARSWVRADLAEYEEGEVPTLYLTIANDTPDELVGRFAGEEELERFPCDSVRVFRDGEQLPHARSPLHHPRPRWRSSIAPGGTLTIALPLDRVCALGERTAGAYRVELASDYHADVRPAAEGALFRIRPAHERGSPPAPALATDPNAPLGLRIRALRELGDAQARARLVLDPEAPVAMAAAASIAPEELAEALPTLELALDHRDLGVRRAAAKRLAAAALEGKALDDATRARLAERSAEERDELVAHHLARATGGERDGDGR